MNRTLHDCQRAAAGRVDLCGRDAGCRGRDGGGLNLGVPGLGPHLGGRDGRSGGIARFILREKSQDRGIDRLASANSIAGAEGDDRSRRTSRVAEIGALYVDLDDRTTFSGRAALRTVSPHRGAQARQFGLVCAARGRIPAKICSSWPESYGILLPLLLYGLHLWRETRTR